MQPSPTKKDAIPASKVEDKASGNGDHAGVKAAADGKAPVAMVRKPGTAKEVPAFQWKLVGYSQGVPLTLLKTVEQDEAEAQMQRYLDEGYYTNLVIHPIDRKIPLPKDLVRRPARPAPSAPKKAAKKPAPKQTVVRIRLKPVEPVAAAKKKTSAKKTATKAKASPTKSPAKAKPTKKTATKAKAKTAVSAKAKKTTKTKSSTKRVSKPALKKKKATTKAARKKTKTQAKKTAKRRR